LERVAGRGAWYRFFDISEDHARGQVFALVTGSLASRSAGGHDKRDGVRLEAQGRREPV